MRLVFYIHVILSASISASYGIVSNGSSLDSNLNKIYNVIKSKGTSKRPKNLVVSNKSH